MRVNEQWIGWRDETQRRMRRQFYLTWYPVYLFVLIAAGLPASWATWLTGGLLLIAGALLAVAVYQTQQLLARVAAIAEEKAK